MGHPDKLCDQISDAVLDAVLDLKLDSALPVAERRVACEALTTTGLVVLAGEVRVTGQRTEVAVNYAPLVREVVREIGVKKKIILPVLSNWVDERTEYHINPTGNFVTGGPKGDAGLTGRKIIVDTYGGMGRHGGGAFSGKDPSKVDRSAAYAARWVAKNLVAAGLARRCEVQIAYAIGVAEPVSVRVDSFGTSQHGDARLAKVVRDCFDLRPRAIIEELGLLRREHHGAKWRYRDTACYGHFGREGFPWEDTGKAGELRRRAER